MFSSPPSPNQTSYRYIPQNMVSTAAEIHDKNEGVSGIIIINYHYHFFKRNITSKENRKSHKFI